jgi:co-chaperonin GroES (HSP10)
MDHSEADPKQDILSKVGDLSGVEVFGNDILCAIYQRPTKTKSGIILTDKAVAEDLWQGKVFLVLKMGPTAFVDENGEKFRDIKEGDWVVGRSSDGWPVQFNSESATSSKDVIPCRILSDLNIRLRVSKPDAIY